MTYHQDFATYSIQPAQTLAGVNIIVPCYNEEKRLNVEAFSRFMQCEPEMRFTFVDDGSQDKTLSVLFTLQRKHPQQVEVIQLCQNSGKAEAVRQGLIHASATDANMIGYWDADLATPLSAISDFARIAQRYDDVNVIYGARMQLQGHRIKRTFSRRMVSRVCSVLARVAVRLPIRDTQCGAKMLRNTKQLRNAISRPFTSTWLFDVELFTRLSCTCKNRQNAFYEFPLSEWHEVPGSKVSTKAILRSGTNMLRLVFGARVIGCPKVLAPMPEKTA